MRSVGGKMMKRIAGDRFSRVMVAMCMALAVGACGKHEGNQASNSDSGQSAGEMTLNIGTIKIAALTNLYAAEKLGYFKREGVKVNFTHMDDGSALLTAISAGKIDIALATPAPPIMAIDKGFDFRAIMQNEVAASGGQDSQALSVLANSGINNLEQLKGKTLAASTIKTQLWVMSEEMFKRKGMKRGDVNYIELPFASMEDALRNKQIDGALTVEPYTSKILHNPNYKVIAYPSIEVLPSQPLGAFWASKKWLDETQGKGAEKFIAAMTKANAYLAAHPDETLSLISEYTGVKLEIVKGMHPVLWNAKVDKATWQKLLDLMHEHGLTKTAIQADTILYHTATDAVESN
jgi:NitT/TauT family transport system substrate-binding protein